MTKIKYILLIIILLASVGAFSQKFTISGYVQDSASGEKLFGANVYDTRSHLGVATNEYGYFSLTLPQDSVSLVVSYIGYGAYSYNFFIDQDIRLNIKLNSANMLSEVVITESKSDQMVKDVQMSIVRLPVEQLKTLPVFMGEADVMKTLQLMPGVQSGNEGTSGIYVRGGGPDQNLILLDGVPVYNANHLFGFFSVFNPDAISSINLIKGGFPAQYSGRLSSVIDIRLKEGNDKKYGGEFSVGTIAAKVMVEGPIWKDHTSFIFSARRTYIDVLAAPVIALINKTNGGGEKLKAGYYFYDANLKLNHKFSDKDRLFLSGYFGRDKAYIKNEEEYFYYDTLYNEKSDMGLYWGNITTSMRWNHVFDQKLFSNVTLIYSNYKFDTYMNYDYLADYISTEKYSFDYFSGINDYGAKIDLNYYPASRHELKLGLSTTYHVFKPGVSVTTQSINNSNDINIKTGARDIYGTEINVYASDNITITGRLKADIGINYSGFIVKKKYYQSAEPRVSARFLITENFSMKAAYTRMTQYVHLLTNSTIGLPTDLWLPATDTITPQRSNQVALGFAYNLKNKWDFSIEGFFKDMKGLIEYKEGASFLNMTDNWESKIEMGRGWSYGAEFLVRKTTGKITGWIGYTLSWAWRQFDNLNFGEKFPYKYDRRHDIAIALIYNKSENFDFGMTWVFGTGNAVTLAYGRYYGINGAEIGEYGGRNSFRAPAYHRLDFNFNFKKQNKLGERIWSLGVYNAYCRQNPFYLYFGTDYRGNRCLKQISLFPIMPSIKFSQTF